MTETRLYSFADFLPTSGAGAYDTRPFFDEYKLPYAEKRISRPVAMLASPEILEKAFPPLDGGGSAPPNTPALAFQANEHEIAAFMGVMLEEEMRLRLTAAETALLRVDTPQTPNEMVIEQVKNDLALVQMYYDLLITGKYDRTNKTLLQNSEDVAMRINEALRQPSHFVDAPELPILARDALASFLDELQSPFKKGGHNESI
jgi:hypothetical protein